MNPKWVGWWKQNIVEIAQGMYAADVLLFYDGDNKGSDRFWCTRSKKHLAPVVRPGDKGTRSSFPSSQNLYTTGECFGLFGCKKL